jgi:HTH-type transcriptional regulator/antitoxin HipB
MRQLVTTPVQLGEILRARRKARRVSQADLARKVGLSQGRLSVLEADPSTLSVERLVLLAKLLGLSIVVQDADDEPPPKVQW